MDAPPPVINPPPTPVASGPAKRHGCLLTWLILMLIMDALMVLGNFAGLLLGAVQSTTTGTVAITEPPWVTLGAAGLYFLDIICVVFIFRWKKWAFFGSVLVSCALYALVVKGGASPITSLTSFIVPIGLYAVLQLGKPVSGWNRLQ